MKFENTEVMNFEGALRGMRNPMNSWDKSDGSYCLISTSEKVNYCSTCPVSERCTGSQRDVETRYIIGKNDLRLAQQLIRAGSEHRKFMRQIFVSVDITAPLYWWKELDQYKIGTTTNSCSTMHKLASTPITMDCFEIDDYNPEIKCEQIVDYDYPQDREVKDGADYIITMLEGLRQKYLKTKDKRFWKELVRWLPESWLQTRTVTMSYENLYTMVHQRKNHKLSEWSVNFIKWAKALPYAQELIFIDKVKE